MLIADAQEDLRRAYLGGGPGVLTSGFVWLAIASACPQSLPLCYAVKKQPVFTHDPAHAQTTLTRPASREESMNAQNPFGYALKYRSNSHVAA